MIQSKKALKLTVLAAALGLASQAYAHGPETKTMALPSIAAGASMDVSITCSHGHSVMSGGVQGIDQLNATGPLVVTGSGASSTSTWTATLTNRSGRPTGANEASVTLTALCGYRH
ncbi:hypothetical protein [Primorskyibacter sp. S187A]|uniref:hypothetical protein n=1 Tax=Primorskyibacter sp. S187A TaxID=3415130 RepID=UPI003C7D4B4B